MYMYQRLLSFLIFNKMLAVKLNTPKNIDLSRSSFNDEEPDVKKMTDLIEEQKRTIRKLNIKIQKVEETLKKERAQRSSGTGAKLDTGQNQHLFDILKSQIEINRQLDEILSKIMSKVKQLIKTMNFDRFFTYNAENKSLNLIYGPKSNKTLSTKQIFFQGEKHQIKEKQKFQPFFKDIIVLQEGLKILNENYRTLLVQNQQRVAFMQKVQIIQSLYKKQVEKRKDLERELDIQRKMKIKFKSLLQKSECQKNVMQMKIDRITFNEKDAINKKCEEWIHFSKSLTLKIQDLQKQKKEIQMQKIRQKQQLSKKNGELLQMVKSLQLTRR